MREQTEHSVLLKHRLRLVKRGAREAKGPRGLADGVLVDVNLAQHLVLDLQQVVGIEEIVVLKRGVGDGLGCGLSVPCRPKGWRFGWRSSGGVMSRTTCKYYESNYCGRQPFNASDSVVVVIAGPGWEGSMILSLLPPQC